VLVDHYFHARLTDFGLSSILYGTKTATKARGAGSLRWMAPELLDPESYGVSVDEAGVLTQESDIYALAITVWEVGSASLT
jgi:serine/threonine protein kinase